MIEAAAALFAAEGYGAVSIDRIAAAVGATKGLFYHHFSAKADILAEIAAAELQAILTAAETALQALPEDAAAETRLEALALAELTAALDRPAAAAVAAKADAILETARLSDAHRDVRNKAAADRQALEALYQSIYRDGVRAGRFEPLPPRFAVWLIRLPIQAAADWSQGPDGARTPPDRVAEAVARFAARGLRETDET